MPMPMPCSLRRQGFPWPLLALAALLVQLPLGRFVAAQQGTSDLRILKINTAADPGSGFVLGPDANGRCVLITVFHVIRDNAASEPLLIQSPSGESFSLARSAFIVDEALDLAFTPAASCARSLALPLARASAITVSERVRILGYPVDPQAEASGRVVPAAVMGRITQYNDTQGYDLNYDAPTHPGYSGGPVINESTGELMAVHGLSDTVGDSQDPDARERLRVGGRGVSAPLLHRFLRRNGYLMPRSERGVCLVGVC
ncbi:MAG: serine protease [Cyanobium sp.]